MGHWVYLIIAHAYNKLLNQTNPGQIHSIPNPQNPYVFIIKDMRNYQMTIIGNSDDHNLYYKKCMETMRIFMLTM